MPRLAGFPQQRGMAKMHSQEQPFSHHQTPLRRVLHPTGRMTIPFEADYIDPYGQSRILCGA